MMMQNTSQQQQMLQQQQQLQQPAQLQFQQQQQQQLQQQPPVGAGFQHSPIPGNPTPPLTPAANLPPFASPNSDIKPTLALGQPSMFLIISLLVIIALNKKDVHVRTSIDLRVSMSNCDTHSSPNQKQERYSDEWSAIWKTKEFFLFKWHSIHVLVCFFLLFRRRWTSIDFPGSRRHFVITLPTRTQPGCQQPRISTETHRPSDHYVEVKKKKQFNVRRRRTSFFYFSFFLFKKVY